MTRPGPNPTPDNPYIYLCNNGPSTYNEMPIKPKATAKQDGVRKLNIQGNYSGSTVKGGGPKVPV